MIVAPYLSLIPSRRILNTMVLYGVKQYFNVLIVEDELIIAHSLKEMVHEMGFPKVEIASSEIKAQIYNIEINIF